MKRLNGRFALMVASALGVSAAAYADTVPAGAVRFSAFGSASSIDVPVPKGQTLVITDIVVSSGDACEFLDGAEAKIDAIRSSGPSLHIGLQTGIEFNTELRAVGLCYSVTLTGYWLDAS